MASEVTRYSASAEFDTPIMLRDSEGSYVRYDDYAALETRLALLDWTEITAENLPKAGDEVLGYAEGWGVLPIDCCPESERDCETLRGNGWTHLRPLNAPPREGESR
jgi:hypothetical protein